MALSSGCIKRRVERETSKLGHAVRSLEESSVGRTYGQTTTHVLADLEHELRFPRHPVWLGVTDGEHECHLRIPGRQGRSDSDSLARRAADWIDCAADHRTRQRLSRQKALTRPAQRILTEFIPITHSPAVSTNVNSRDRPIAEPAPPPALPSRPR